MKKILAFLALASLAQVTFAQATTGANYDTATAVTSGTVISNPLPTGGGAVAPNTCGILSASEPAVTINLSRDVLAALHCNTGVNAAGGATQHPGGRPAGCTGARCAYIATTSGGPVTAVPAAAVGAAAPTSGTALVGCAARIAAHTSGTVSTAVCP